MEEHCVLNWGGFAVLGNEAIWRVSERVETDNLDKHLIHLNPDYL